MAFVVLSLTHIKCCLHTLNCHLDTLRSFDLCNLEWFFLWHIFPNLNTHNTCLLFAHVWPDILPQIIFRTMHTIPKNIKQWAKYDHKTYFPSPLYLMVLIANAHPHPFINDVFSCLRTIIILHSARTVIL